MSLLIPKSNRDRECGEPISLTRRYRAHSSTLPKPMILVHLPRARSADATTTSSSPTTSLRYLDSGYDLCTTTELSDSPYICTPYKQREAPPGVPVPAAANIRISEDSGSAPSRPRFRSLTTRLKLTCLSNANANPGSRGVLSFSQCTRGPRLTCLK